jgi:hypothetical protein
MASMLVPFNVSWLDRRQINYSYPPMGWPHWQLLLLISTAMAAVSAVSTGLAAKYRNAIVIDRFYH